MTIAVLPRPYGKGLEETAMHIAMLPWGYDDELKPVRHQARSDHDIRLAFAVLLELADLLDDGRCDARTVTGRAIQAALVVATEARIMRRRKLWEPDKIATSIVMVLLADFFATKSAHDKLSVLLLSLGGFSSHRLGVDPSGLRRRIKSDLEAIEHRFGHLCKKNKALRKTWRRPQMANQMCYNDLKDGGSGSSPATSFDAPGIDPDFDNTLTDDIYRMLFD
jgi:hypothetical protein